MSILRRSLQSVGATLFVILLVLLHKLNTDDPLRVKHRLERERQLISGNSPGVSPSRHVSIPTFRYGRRKSSRSNYSQVIVMPRMRNDDVSWLSDELPEMDTAVYVADDPTAILHPPRNKGHEVMIYLSYIIDHYLDLPDTIIFMHEHRWTHHNIELLGHDSVEMVRRLSNDYVAQEGYVNLRCQWSPGCPAWLHPQDTHETLAKQEQVVLTQSWSELFPSAPLPRDLGQACCAQFALSKERVLSIPLSRYVFYRDWILRTPLTDYISGRIWEYLWQFLFTGKGVHCPSEQSCHCQGFGICFGDDNKWTEYEELRRTREGFEAEMRDLRQQRTKIGGEEKGENSSLRSESSDSERYSKLSVRLEGLSKEIMVRQQKALKRGLSQETRFNNAAGRWMEHRDF